MKGGLYDPFRVCGEGMGVQGVGPAMERPERDGSGAEMDQEPC